MLFDIYGRRVLATFLITDSGGIYIRFVVLLLFDLGMLSSDVILRKIRENMDVIRGFGVRRIGLFGSYARGEQRPDSDVDILVEFEDGMKTFDNYMGLKIFLEDLLGCRVDLVVLDSVKPRLKPYILGSVIYAT